MPRKELEHSVSTSQLTIKRKQIEIGELDRYHQFYLKRNSQKLYTVVLKGRKFSLYREANKPVYGERTAVPSTHLVWVDIDHDKS